MTVNGTTTNFVIDGQNVVQEGYINRHGDFVSNATYINGERGVECRRDDTNTAGTYEWYLYDGLGSVIGEVDASGNVTYTAKYDVFGILRDSTGTSTSKHKFVGGLGHTTEPDTGGLVYMRARWYDPAAGRFISEDPKCDGDNWYAYCDENPVNNVDKTGKSSDPIYDLLRKLAEMGAIAGATIFAQQCVAKGYELMLAGGANVAAGAVGLYRTITIGMGLGQELGEAWSFANGTKYGMQTQMGVAQVVNGATLAMTAAVDAILIGIDFGVDINPFK